MCLFYDLDSSRVSHREYWWGNKSPLVLVGWITKWLGIRLPGSSDDLNTESTLPFMVEALPEEIKVLFQPLVTEFANLGFVDPTYHEFHDWGTRTSIYWATFRHASGRHFARIHHRVWEQTQATKRGLFPLFFTEFKDRTFFVSSAGKPDLAAPATIRMNRMHGAKADKLWSAHERIAESLAAQKGVAQMATRQELILASERHHMLTRDFHLARGVFRQRSTAEQARADAFADQMAQAKASGLEHAEVLAELERLQTQKPGWGNAIWFLVGSAAVFLAAGAAQWNLKFTLWLVPILFFHEAGHWLAMRIFRYRNLRMFFIPFFGAAVTGQNWNVAGWKKALVSLAGPVPGIFLGVVLGCVGLMVDADWLGQAALVLLLVNGFNLLPFLPLDGGHVLHATLFCRNRWLDAVFRAVAVAGLAVLALAGVGHLFMFLAIALATALPISFKLGKVADTLRVNPPPPLLPGDDLIPPSTAQAIISALRKELPQGVNNKFLAQHTLSLFETLNARPPEPLATLALLAVHAAFLFLALFFSVLLIVSRH